MHMKIIVIGSTGTIGAAVVRALSPRHDVIGVHRRGDPRVDITDANTVERLFAMATGVDAVVCCAGAAAFKPLAQLTEEDLAYSLANKLMGQVHVIRTALPRIADRGSITVTSGVLAQRPQPGSAAVSLVNAGLEGFVRAAALEAPRGIRVNAVSPPWVKETLTKLGMDPSPGMTADDVAQAYVAAVEGTQRGEALDPARVR
jgi:NAD(P)-dependent dehydrogenase (short-subunit alcohol dehydrogenase family)